MKKINVKTFEKPDFSVWKQDIPDEDRLKIINETDFDQFKLLNNVGIVGSGLADSFGITDAAEIRARIELLKFLTDNPDSLSVIKGNVEEGRKRSLLPGNKESFINFYDPEKDHNPFWQVMHNLKEQFSKSNSYRLTTLANYISDSIDEYEESEKKMSDFIGKEIEKIAVIEGALSVNMDRYLNIDDPDYHRTNNELTTMFEKRPNERFVLVKDRSIYYLSEYFKPDDMHNTTGGEYVDRLNHYGLKIYDFQIIGHSEFSFDVLTAGKHQYPKWTFQKYNPVAWLFGNFRERQIDRLNKKEMEKAYQAMVITKPKWEMLVEIMQGIMNRLNELDEEIIDHLRSQRADIDVRFMYDEDGLSINIMDIRPNYPVESPRMKYGSFYGYRQEDKKVINKIGSSIYQRISDSSKGHRLDEFRKKVREATYKEKDDKGNEIPFEDRDSFFNHPVTIDSPMTDKLYRWFAVNNFYHSPTFKDLFDQLTSLRSYFTDQFWIVNEVCDIAKAYIWLSERVSEPICAPNLLDDGKNVVSFKEVYPLRLLNVKSLKIKDIKNISNLPPLNGQIVALTGRHGGGKSVGGQTIMELIWLTMSGLLILGKEFSTNPKKVIGLVVNEEGDGSTAQNLVGKMAKLLEGVKTVKPHEAVVFVDEIGKGTQQQSGIELGVDLLSALQKRGVSVIFNTQILQLAEHVVSNLNAIAMQVDDHHRFSPGIGDGGMNDLRKIAGFDKALKALN